MKNKLYGWVLQNKDTDRLEPTEWGRGSWGEGSGIQQTRKELTHYDFSRDVYKPVRVEIKLIIPKKI